MSLYKKVILIICIFCSTASFSQNLYYAYFETENNQPFFAIVNGIYYSSTLSGYLIVPKLINGKYSIKVGFPTTKQQDLEGSFSVNNKDEGYVIKSAIGNKLSLFSLTDLQVVQDTVSSFKGSITRLKSEIKQEQLQEIYVDRNEFFSDTISIQIPLKDKVNKVVSSNCSIATNDDFLRVKLQMTSLNSETDRVEQTKRIFSNNCFSTEQIKNLSSLFLDEKNKLNFLLLAKPFVYDSKNFAALQLLLMEQENSTKFKNAL